MKKYLIGALFTVLLTACGHKKMLVEPSFYYWRSEYRSTPAESQLLDTLKVKKLYVKYFDLDWDRDRRAVAPEATIAFDSTAYRAHQIVPVVYITNTTLANISPGAIIGLADSICQKVKRINYTHHILPAEIQLDCDWSINTREKYFALLRRLKQRIPQNTLLSCTIRLHQVKYREKTGVPPVGRGVLMFYNMGKIENEKEVNTIYDPANAQKYLDRLSDYPLSLDVALPIFSWAVVYTDDKPKLLLNGFSKANFDGDKRFKDISDSRYRVDSTCFIHGYYLKQNDLIRIEQITPYLCLQAAIQLSDHLKPEKRTVIFFDLQPSNINRYEIRDFEKILDILR